MKLFNLKNLILHEIQIALHFLFDLLTLVKLFAQFDNNDKFPKTCQNNMYVLLHDKHTVNMQVG